MFRNTDVKGQGIPIYLPAKVALLFTFCIGVIHLLQLRNTE